MRAPCLLAGLLAVLLVVAAVPAAADDGPSKPAQEKARIEKEVQKLTRELKKLQAQLAKLRETTTDEHPRNLRVMQGYREAMARLAEARRRLAEVEALRPTAPDTKPKPGVDPRRRRRGPAGPGAPGRGPAGEGPRGPAAGAGGPPGPGGPPTDRARAVDAGVFGAFRRMQAEVGALSKRVDTLEHQIRRLAAALPRGSSGSQDDRPRGDAPQAPKPPKAPKAPRGDRPPRPDGPPGPGAHPPGDLHAAVMARLTRIEKMLERLTTERAGGRRGGARGPRARGAQGPRARGAQGPRARGARGGPPGGPRWARILGSRAQRAAGPQGGPFAGRRMGGRGAMRGGPPDRSSVCPLCQAGRNR